jgi:CTP:molybdopterin cytidylyltransferase MocA
VTAAGLVLAAGAGTRFGRPKATVLDPDGSSWLRRAVASLTRAGCDPVVVVLGAGAEDAARLLDGLAGVEHVVAADWADGLGASLRTGLGAVGERASGDTDVVVITLVDLPDVGVEVTARLLAAADVGPDTLLRATYGGRPGHPVVVGRRHWLALAGSLRGDSGGAAYLAEHRATTVECGDLATGHDVDLRPGPG